MWVASEEHVDGGAGPGQAKGEGNPLGAESGPTMVGGARSQARAGARLGPHASPVARAGVPKEVGLDEAQQ